MAFHPLRRGMASLGSRAFWLAGALLWGALAAEEPRVSTGPAMEFVSATLTSGPGREPPAGTVLKAHEELVGVVRVFGLDTRRSSIRLTLVAPSETGSKPKRTRLIPTSWRRLDPKDPSLIRWTAPWPGAASAEGWMVKIESLRSRPRVLVSGSVLHVFLPKKPVPLTAE